MNLKRPVHCWQPPGTHQTLTLPNNGQERTAVTVRGAHRPAGVRGQGICNPSKVDGVHRWRLTVQGGGRRFSPGLHTYTHTCLPKQQEYTGPLHACRRHTHSSISTVIPYPYLVSTPPVACTPNNRYLDNRINLAWSWGGGGGVATNTSPRVIRMHGCPMGRLTDELFSLEGVIGYLTVRVSLSKLNHSRTVLQTQLTHELTLTD